MQSLQAMAECDEVRQLSAALTAKVRVFRNFGGAPYGGLPLAGMPPGMQSWEHSGVMQELMKSIGHGQMVADEVASPFSPPGADALGMPGEEMDFADKKAWFDWFASLDLFEGSSSSHQEVQAPGPALEPHYSSENVALEPQFFPPLPIAPPFAPQQSHY
jgi:hypothetical protein